jgi:hypothetical protein
MYRDLVEIRQGTSSLARPKHRREDTIERNVKIDSVETEMSLKYKVEWRAFVNMVRNLRVS